MGVLKFFVYFGIASVMFFLSIILGEKAPWYFAWILGTVMIILIAVSGAVLLEGQAEEQKRPSGAPDV